MDNTTKIKFFRMSNGDDIITEIADANKGTITIVNPMRLVVEADLENGKQIIYMHSWMPQGIAKGNSCSINIKNILFFSDVEEDIIEYYCGVVFDIFTDAAPLKKREKEYMDEDKKVISFGKPFKAKDTSNERIT